MVDSYARDSNVKQRVDAIRTRFMARDRRAADVRAVRHGDFDQIAPGSFSEDFPRPIVANMIDTYAKHAAAALSPLPRVTCQSASMASDRAKAFADKRTKIANNYLKRSRLQAQMQQGADQFYTYGLLITEVSPNFDEKMPDVFVNDSTGYYPVWDRHGRTIEVGQVFRRRLIELKAEFPDLKVPLSMESQRSARGDDREVEVYRYADKNRIVLTVPECNDLVLSQVQHNLGRCPIVATKKQGLDEEIRGSFDDLIWVQIARHTLQMLTLQAADEAVNAPLIVPQDVTDVPTGPGAVIRTTNPQGVNRANLQVPNVAWAAVDHLKQEMQTGAITPEAMGGSIDASVVTGRGVQELMAGYSQQIAMGQETLVGHFQQVVEICFLVDEKLWPDVDKQIAGTAQGAPFKITYRPSRDIDGDHTVDVAYGGIAGLDPNRALIYLLQEQGGGIVSRDYVRRNVVGEINATEEEAKIVLEQARDSLVQGISGLGQSIPGIIAQGGDAADTVAKIAKIAAELQKGKPIEEVAAKVFAPPEPVQPEPGSPESAGPGAAGEPAFDAFAAQPGADATAGPGGRPSLQQLFAGIGNSGQAQLSAGVSRMNPVA